MRSDKYRESDKYSESVGQLIRRRRQHHGLDQYRLADRLAEVSGNESVKRDHVARWERGKRLPAPYWRHWLSIALELSADELDRASAVTRMRRTAVASSSGSPV